MSLSIVTPTSDSPLPTVSDVHLSEEGELRITLGANATPEQLVFLADICALAKRVQVHRPWAKQEILLLLENAAKVALVGGDVEKGTFVFKKAEDAYFRDMQTRNRLWYVMGTGIGVVALIVLAGCCVSLSKQGVGVTLAAPEVIISLFAFAGIGSVTSVLTRLSALDLKEETSKPMILLSGASKPLVAMAFAALVYIVLENKIIEVKIGSGTSKTTDAVYWVAAFLCGFSERFAGDILARLDPPAENSDKNTKKT